MGSRASRKRARREARGTVMFFVDDAGPVPDDLAPLLAAAARRHGVPVPEVLREEVSITVVDWSSRVDV